MSLELILAAAAVACLLLGFLVVRSGVFCAVGRFADRCVRRALSLNDDERQSMMTVALVLGLISLTTFLIVIVFLLRGHPEHLFPIALMLGGLMLALIGGGVAIAMGGTISAKIANVAEIEAKVEAIQEKIS